MAVIELVESEENINNEWEEKIPTELYEKLSDIALFTLKLKNLSNRKILASIT
jgi:type III secretion system FlhB-like substrate exporter